MSLHSDFPSASVPIPVHSKFKQRKCETFLFEAALFNAAKAKKDKRGERWMSEMECLKQIIYLSVTVRITAKSSSEIKPFHLGLI